MADRDLTGFVLVARLHEIPVGESRIFKVEDESIALCNVKGTIYAINNICTHDSGPLGEGKIFGFEVECPRHGARFDVRDGSVTAMPAAVEVDTFETVVKGEDIYVRLDY